MSPTRKIVSLAPAFAIAAFCLTGCASSFKLPEVAGKSVTYRRTDPFGGTTVSATNVVVTAEEIRAGSVTWTTGYPQFSISLTVEEYVQKREKEETK